MTTSTAAAALKPATYRVDPDRSTVRFTAKGMFGLVPVEGTFRIRHGAVFLSEDLEVSTASAVIDAGSVDTANERRDRDLRSKRFLDTARYPDISFTSEMVAGGSVTGTLRVQETSRPVTLTPDAHATADGCRFTATARIDRYAFGLTGGKGFVSRYTNVELDIWCTEVPAS
jgi:polyisoprenoid-binding protein YceI